METVKEFGIQPVLLLAQGINFLVLVLLLRRFLYGPIVRMLEQRRARIATSLSQAAEIEKRLSQTKQEQEEMLKDARHQALEIVGQAKAASESIIAKSQNEAKILSEKMVAQAQIKIREDQETMRDQLRDELAHLVVLTTGKLIGRVLSENDQKRLLNEVTSEVAKG